MMRDRVARMASLPVFKIVIFGAWMLVPVICFLLVQLPGWHYTDQKLPIFWAIVFVVGVFWACSLLAMLFSSPHFDLGHQDLRSLGKIAAGMFFFSWMAAGSVGELAFGLLNCAADRSEGQEAVVKAIGHDWRTTIFRTEPPFGTFKCGQAMWNTAHEEGRRFFVHPGRLGAVWGEFR